MSRKARASHPALVARGVREEVARRDEEELVGLEGWETFNTTKKQFLAVLPWYGRKAEASRAIGRGPMWYTTAMSQDKLFKAAVNARRDAAVRIARAIAADLLGMSMLRLQEMLLPDSAVDKRVQMEAIKHLHEMQGLVRDEGRGLLAGAVIGKANILMFRGGGGREEKVIEVFPEGKDAAPS